MVNLILFFISFVFLLFVARWIYNGLFGPTGALAASSGVVKLAVALVAIFGSALMAGAVAFFATDLLKGSDSKILLMVEEITNSIQDGTFNIFNIPGPLMAGSLIGLFTIIFMVAMVGTFLFGPAREAAGGKYSGMLAFITLVSVFLLVGALIWGVTDILSGPESSIITFMEDTAENVIDGATSLIIFELPQ